MTLSLHRGKLDPNAEGVLVIPDADGVPHGVIGWPEWWPGELVARFAAVILEAVIDLTEWPGHPERRRGTVRPYELDHDSWLEVPDDGGVLVGAYEETGIGLRSQGMPDALDGPLACALVVEIGNAIIDDGFDPLDDAASWPRVPVNLADMFERHAQGLPPLRRESAPKLAPKVDPRQMVLL